MSVHRHRAPKSRRKKSRRLRVEALERLDLPSAAHPLYVVFNNHLASPFGTSSPTAYTPAQIRHAYGFDRLSFVDSHGQTVAADGSGQTIAIVDAYDDPNIRGDLQAFDRQFNLPDPQLTVVAQDGSNNLPGTDPAGPGTTNWEGEEALDVEWAHAIAPGANILLIEANSSRTSDLYTAVDYARNLPGVSVISMSFGHNDSSSDPGNNGHFDTPNAKAAVGQWVTFVASSGDFGVISSPASTPSVLAVGGTQLSVDGSNNWSSETAWSGSGGGISQYQALPSYQQGVVPNGTTGRGNPDVAYNAAFGVAVYDSYNNGTATPWSSTGGTSAGAPQWAALVAVADQGRVLTGQAPLDSLRQTIPWLYTFPSSDFHDITSGSNAGFSAGTGYDFVTGLGTPVANRVVQHLIHGPYAVAPRANDDTYTIRRGQATLSVDAAHGVLANDTDTEQDPLTAVLVSGPSNGSLTLNADGSFSYTPNSSFAGQDSFTYLARDVDGASTTATVTINLQTLQPPVAVNDSYSMRANSTLTVDASLGVLRNDSDAEGDPIRLWMATQPAHGQVSVYTDGSFVYTPNYGFEGTDSFTYRDIDVDGGSNWATVSIYVAALPPVASDTTYVLAGANTPLTVSAANGLRSLVHDFENDPFSVVLGSGPHGGKLVLNPSDDGSFTYTPGAGFNHYDTFTYVAWDKDGHSNVATVTLLLPEQPPVAHDDAYTALENKTLTVGGASVFGTGVLTNDTDAEGDFIRCFAYQGRTAHGHVKLNANGSFAYTPDQNFYGLDGFRYTDYDIDGRSNVATVTLTVQRGTPHPLSLGQAPPSTGSGSGGLTLGGGLSGPLAAPVPVPVTSPGGGRTEAPILIDNLGPGPKDGTALMTPPAGNGVRHAGGAVSSDWLLWNADEAMDSWPISAA
jgi:VCBS repeat-containing protein